MTECLNQKRAAFTLAELLVTLVILGVVATMTIAVVIPKYQEHVLLIQFKKAYAYIQNAYDVAKIENGPITNWGMTSSSTSGKFSDTGMTYATSVSKDSDMVLRKILGIISLDEVKYEDYIINYFGKGNLTLQGTQKIEKTFVTRQVSRDGAAYSLWLTNHTCTTSSGNYNNICAELWVDVNGSKKPNTIGKDIFLFWVTADAIVPMGEKGDNIRPFNSYCNKDNEKQFNGYACSSWVLKNENMDYLRKTVSW